MYLLIEWTLAIHRAAWFPFIWMTGLEAAAVDTGWLSPGAGTPSVKAVANRRAA